MYKLKTLFTLWAALFASANFAQNGQTTTHLTGELCDTTIDEIILHRIDRDNRMVNPHISVPFKNGRFCYDLHTNGTEVFTISTMKRNAGYYVDFFAEGDTVHIRFHAEKAAEWHADTPLNKELLRMTEEINGPIPQLEKDICKMEEEGRDLTPEGRSVKDRYEKALAEEADRSVLESIAKEAEQLKKENRLETQEYQDLKQKITEAVKASERSALDYARSHPDPVGLLCLYKAAKKCDRPYAAANKKEVAEIFRKHFAGKMPGFHLTEFMKNFCESTEVSIGGKFRDFTAPDAQGTPHRLSEEIKGKVALIDLWASWCGPCRRTSMSMIPVYEDYKDKGFTIVGVARENAVTDMLAAVENDKYPWLNLIELNDQRKIWQHYGVNAAGRTFLVDSEGTILAIAPTADEVRAILEKILGKQTVK